MEKWLKITFILCIYGILREIRPSEPYVSEYLMSSPWNISKSQLNKEVYPLGTYSSLAALFVVLLITDFLRFKPVIILSGVCGCIMYAILLWGYGHIWIQSTQILYGIYIATEIAYYTYIYIKVDASKYAEVSSYTRMALLTGRCFSGFSSQILVSYDIMDYRQLNYITFTAQCMALLWLFMLPSVQYSIYFHRKNPKIISEQLDMTSPISSQVPMHTRKQSFYANTADAFSLIMRHAYSAYSRPKVLAWSFLYAIILATFVLVQTYMQLLWKHFLGGENHHRYNGLVEALQTILGAGGAYLSKFLCHSILPAPIAVVQAAVLFLAIYLANIYVCYVSYIIVGVLYHQTITLCSAKIASQLSDESCFGLVFGVNSLLGAGAQTLFTILFIETMRLPIDMQYYIYCVIYLILATVWTFGWLISSLCNRSKQNFIIDSLN